MKLDLAAAARIVPLTALMLGACVSQSAYDKGARRTAASKSCWKARGPETWQLRRGKEKE